MPQLGWTFTDALPEANAQLQYNEQTLFLTEDPNEPVTLDKTQLEGGDLYTVVSIEGQRIRLPNPFQFRLSPRRQSNGHASRVLVVYDNAGEHFLPGEDRAGAPVTEHLAKAQVIVFLLDPTQDARLRAQLNSDDPQLDSKKLVDQGGLVRQETVLAETVARVRSLAGLGPHDKHSKPMIIALAKSDLWGSLLGEDLPEPFVPQKESGQLALDVEAVRRISRKCRDVLKSVCPEIVAIAEDFAKTVLYIPTSATGCSPIRIQGQNGEFLGFRAGQIQPKWACVPVVCAIQGAEPSLVPIVRHGKGAAKR